MATDTTTTQNENGNQAVGKALIVYGSVQAQTPDGAIRILQPNSPIFANDRIITGGDGMISIVFGDPGNTQLDLGRMSDVQIDEDVFQGNIPADINDATAEVEKIQQALLDGNLDPTVDLEAAAAGPAAAAVASAGGGHDYVKFDLTGEEVTPVSGAETTGITRNFIDPNQTILEPVADVPIEPIAPLAAAPPPAEAPPADIPPDIPPPPVDTIPVAGDVVRAIDEENFADGTNPNVALLTTSGTLADLGVSFGSNLPGSLDFGGGNTIDIDNGGDTTINIVGTYGTLTVNDDGSWSYTVADNIVHPQPGTTGPGDSLPDIFNFSAVDADGDSDPGSITINIYDDGPIATGAEIDRVLEEEALDNYLGGTPDVVGSDGNPDESDGPEDATQPDSAVVTGSFASLVNVGADNPGTFSIVSVGDLPPLFSQGGAITYVINGDTIEAWVYGDGGGEVLVEAAVPTQGEADRLVFTLEVLPNGNYTFTLLDQLDHVAPTEGISADENIGLISGDGSVDFIDFSTAIQVTDTDNDSVSFTPGTLTFTLVDDIPVANEQFRGIEVVAHEDGLSQELGDSGDLSEGNREPGETLTDDEDNGSSGSLSGIFSVGADEGATYGITTDKGTLSGLDTLFSKGEQLYYSSDGTTLTANTAADGSGRTAFTLTVDPDGSWHFDLDDQLDHVDDGTNTENWALLGSSSESGGLDVSSILTITDFDGDSATGAAAGAFVINVQDDVPADDNTGTSFFVSEYAGFNNIIGTYELDENGDPVNAQLLIASSNNAAGGNMGENEQQLGAYGAGTKFFVIADGANALGDLSGSTLNFVANAGPGPAWILEIDGSTAYSAPVYYMDVALNADGQEHFKDENGNFLNEVPPEGGEIRIEDLSLGDADYDDTVLRVEMGPVVDEANLPDGTDPDAGLLTVHGNLLTGMGGVQLTVGADEPGTLTVASETIALNNDGPVGPSQSLVLDGSGDFITVLSDAGTLIVNDDGTWSYTLTDNTLVHPDNDPGGNDHTDGDSDRGSGDQVQDIFDLTFTDADGDQMTPQIVININDDGPEANEDTRGVFASVEEDDMNLGLPDDDLSQGINEEIPVNADETSGGPGSLATLFNVGADNENVTYGLTSDFSSMGDLKSHGEALNYNVSGDTLTASTSYGDVFTLQVNADGSWNFDLKDQLDHVADGNTEGTVLEGSTAPGGNGIDFSSVVMVTDADGDAAYGAVDNSFIISVQDDIPVAEEVEQIPANLNLVLILDNSGSMYSNKITWDGHPDTSRIVALQSAVLSLLGTLEASAADNIRINIVEYNTDAHSLGTFDLKVNGVVVDSQAAIDAVNNLVEPTGYDVYTNYEAGYQQALQWTDGGDPSGEPLTAADVTGDIVNQVLFISDGDPNKYNSPDLGEPGGPDPDPNGNSTASASTALDQVTGSDGSNELAALNAWADSVRAIGISVNSGQDDRLDSLDGQGNAVNIQSGDELTAILPSLLTSSEPLISALVQEDDLTVDNDLPGDPDSATGNNEDGSVNADEAMGSADPQNLANLFKSGADEPLTFELATNTSGLPELWSAGEKLIYAVNGNILTATAHGDQIFTFTVNTNGTWHFDLDGQLDHVATEGENLALVSGPDATGHVDSIDLSSLIVATDADHDQVMANAGAFVIEVADDIPIAGDPQDAILANEDGNNLVADLNIDFGADGPGTVAITPDADNIGSSNKVIDNDGNFLYIDGQKLYWHDNGDGSWQAQTSAGVVGFIVAPEADGNGFTGNYTVELQNAVDDVIKTFSKSFGGSGGGNATQRDLYSGDVHIAVTAIDPGSSDPDKVNWSTQGMGVGNEFVEQDNTGTHQNPTYVTEQLVIDFSKTSTGESLFMDQVTFGLDHLDKATGYFNPVPAEVATWTAYNGNDIVGTGQVIGTANGSSDGADQFLTINDSNTTGDFDRVVFSAANTLTDYRVTSVQGSYAEPSEHEFDFDVVATDGDGDTVHSSFDMTIDSDGNINGGNEAEVISGSSGNDTIDGGGGDDVIAGHAGDDIIDGGGGNDTLGGGEGDDTVDGGEGDDAVFGGAGEDTINGGTGDDTVGGGADTDAVTGGDGADTFDTTEEGAGETTDYDAGEDDLDNLVPPPEVA